MERVVALFEAISKIPHCSGNTASLQAFIEQFAESKGYECESDEAGNILTRKGKPTVCLQAHYDMVCIGDYENLRLVREGNILRADRSTLGADNGIGVAMMLALMEEGHDIECLFTNDEEIGLIGAKALDLEIRSRYLLNLDSEEEGRVYIGCAGGFDVTVHVPLTPIVVTEPLCRIKTRNYPGGHSGIQIDKNIPNALKDLLFFLDEHNLPLYHFHGGERHNSIPVHAYALTSIPEGMAVPENLEVDTMDRVGTLYDCRDLSRLLRAFPTGVRSWNAAHGIPHDSINLAKVRIEQDTALIEISARSMDNASLKRLESETRAFFEGYRLDVKDGYPAWAPEMSEFAKEVMALYEATAGSCEVGVIHAGLECAVIKDKAPHLDAVSMGPNIYAPHTDREYTELDSVGRVFEIVKKVIAR